MLATRVTPATPCKGNKPDSVRLMAGGVGLFLRVYRWTAGIQALPIMETEFFSPPSFVPLFSTPVRLGSDWRENSEGPVRPVEPGATVCLFVKVGTS